MKLARLLVLIFTAFIAISNYTHAQSINSENLKEVKVDDLSNADIKAYYQKATAAGLSEEQLYKMALERGMPEAEISKLKLRIAKINSPENAASEKKDELTEKKDESTEKKENGTDRMVDQDAMKVPMKRIIRDSTIFGSELFSESSMVFEPNLRIPSPGNYILGPDDQLVVNVFGYSEQTYNLTVDAEGNVYIPGVGPIKVSGLSIEVAADKIRNKLASTIYKAIRSGKTHVEVSLGKIRSIRVTVIGQATKPGTYTVSSLTTLFNMLYLCGGPNDMGSFRNIELVRGSKTIRKVDLYAFLLAGDRNDNILLQEQDVIRIPYYDTRVFMTGEVKRPGKFELHPSESFEQLLTYSGGFADSAYRNSVQVSRISDIGITLSDVTSKDFASFMPRTGDGFRVMKGINRFMNRVTLKGAVRRPGDFELKPGMALKELLETAGGLRGDAFTERGLITRQNEDLTFSTKAFVVKDVISGKEIVPLKKEDVISVSSILDLRDAMTVSLDGAVRNPGIFAYSDSITLKDVILKGGGLSETAKANTIEISRRVKNPDIKQADFRQTEILIVDISKGLSSAAGETLLQPYDIVNVRAEPGYSSARTVVVQGQVMSEGRYVLETSGERISNLIKRAGGFKGSADSSSITIRRYINSNLTLEERKSIAERMLNIEPDSLESDARLRESFFKNVELLGVNVQKIKDNRGGNEDLILEDGDVITIARASNLVRVNGEVFHPTLLPFENNTSAKYYIKRSGDFTNHARKSAVFVIYPDGRAKSVKKFLFFKSYPSVTPRSEVYVPSKERDNKKGMGPGEWVAFSSIIASLATLIVAVVNSN